MRLRLDLAVTVPKDPERLELNEDAWASDEAVTRLAVCDGASESFDSKTWGRLIAHRYAQDSSFSPNWVSEAVALYLSTVDYSALSWSKQAAFERGSFTTLLGVELAPDRSEVEVLAIGDSVAFHLSSGKLVGCFPYTTAEEFDVRPQLLSTIAANNEFMSQPRFFGENTSRSWTLEPGDVLLLATDAVSQWALLEQGCAPSALEQLSSIADQAAFERLVLDLRHERRVRLDDSTLLRLIAEA